MLEIRNLNLYLNNKKILDDINIQFIENKITIILGKNGSGKSSIINCINQIYRYNGSIYYNNQDLKKLDNRDKARKIAILPQFLKYPHIKVFDLVLMGRSPYRKIGEKYTEEDFEIVNKYLKEIGIEKFKNEFIDNLSGGERQKVYLAMLLTQDTDIIILDEPTTFMDIDNENSFLDLIKSLKNNYNKTIIVIMHNINKVINIADEIIIINNGKIIFNGPKEEVLNKEIIENQFNVRKIFIDNLYYYV